MSVRIFDQFGLGASECWSRCGLEPTSGSDCSGCWTFSLDLFFVALACHSPELDGFEQHFQATVHFSLTCAVDEPQQHRKLFSSEKPLGILGINPGAAGWEASSMQPPPPFWDLFVVPHSISELAWFLLLLGSLFSKKRVKITHNGGGLLAFLMFVWEDKPN